MAVLLTTRSELPFSSSSSVAFALVTSISSKPSTRNFPISLLISSVLLLVSFAGFGMNKSVICWLYSSTKETLTANLASLSLLCSSRDNADVEIDYVGGGLVAESGGGRFERLFARAHRERFAAARSALGQHRGVVAAEEVVEKRLHGRLVDLDLGRGL